jgi:hypothetical protein
MQETEINPYQRARYENKFQRFVNKAPHSAFKKLIISTPTLLQDLHTMSLTTSVPNRLKPRECKRTKLREPPPFPYIPKKDKVQDKVARLRNLQIKTLLEKDTTLNFLVWHKNGTCKAIFLHVMAVLDAMKKHGHFKDYHKAQKAQDEAKKAVKLAEVGLAMLDGKSAGMSSKHKKRALAKAKEATKEALAKVLGPESEAKEAEEVTKVTNNMMKMASRLILRRQSKPRRLPRVQ